jgi:general secretion pathway protein A
VQGYRTHNEITPSDTREIPESGPGYAYSMYLTFFGLNQAPFSIAPDPHYLYMSERHREALAHLLYGVEGEGGFVVLTGEIGAGKTTVCRCLLEQIPEHCQVAYIFNPKLTVLEMMQSVCDELGVTYDREATASVKSFVDPLNAHLLASHALGRHILLIIDEAQNLSSEVLEQLRLLTNLETDSRKLLQIILIGQPELRDILARPELEQLEQRVIARFHLKALSAADTVHYVRHRLGVAGLQRAQPFTPQALQRIHELSRGIPRRINLLCDRAMLGAYALNQRRIDPNIIDQAALEVFGPRRSKSKRRKSERSHLPPDELAAPGWHPALMSMPSPRWVVAVAAAVVVIAGVIWLVNKRPATKPAVTGAGVATAQSGQTQGKPGAAASTKPPPLLPSPAALMAWASTEEESAWKTLAPLWKMPNTAGAVCSNAPAVGLACYRFASSNLAWVRNANRPVVLTLRGPSGSSSDIAHVALLDLDEKTAVLARSANDRCTVSLATLGALWRGELGALWRAPKGFSNSLTSGQRGPAVDALAAGLARWQGLPTPPGGAVMNDRLKNQVISFQSAFGLKPDGIAGPPTFMQLNRALGVSEPTLLSGR